MLTNRTPRSTSRRASRQLRGELAELRPCPPPRRALIVGLGAVDAVHRPASPASRSTGRSAPGRPTACGRPVRRRRCGWRSPGRRSLACRCRLRSRERVDGRAAACSSVRPAGLFRFSTGSPWLRNSTPCVGRRQKAARPVRRAAAGAAAGGEHDVAGQVLATRCPGRSSATSPCSAGRTSARRCSSAAGRDDG